MKWCVLVLVFAGLSKGDNAINTNIFNCPELNSQEEIDLDKVRAIVVTVVRPLRSANANTTMELRAPCNCVS